MKWRYFIIIYLFKTLFDQVLIKIIFWSKNYGLASWRHKERHIIEKLTKILLFSNLQAVLFVWGKLSNPLLCHYYYYYYFILKLLSTEIVRNSSESNTTFLQIVVDFLYYYIADNGVALTLSQHWDILKIHYNLF